MQVASRGRTRVSSALVIRMRLFQQSNVGEGEMASLAFALTLPLAIHVDLGDFNHVSHLYDDNKQHRLHSSVYEPSLFMLNARFQADGSVEDRVIFHVLLRKSMSMEIRGQPHRKYAFV